VNAIMGAADAVIFSAACIGQPGDDHINSQWQSYWAKKFTAAGFLIYDFFRPTHWMNGQVEPWYQQNMLLFVRPIHELAIAFKSAGIQPLENPAFVDLVHPWLYDLTLQKATSPKRGITRILSFVRHLHRRA
jgi:hypothetical protein